MARWVHNNAGTRFINLDRVDFATVSGNTVYLRASSGGSYEVTHSSPELAKQLLDNLLFGGQVDGIDHYWPTED